MRVDDDGCRSRLYNEIDFGVIYILNDNLQRTIEAGRIYYTYSISGITITCPLLPSKLVAPGSISGPVKQTDFEATSIPV